MRGRNRRYAQCKYFLQNVMGTINYKEAQIEYIDRFRQGVKRENTMFKMQAGVPEAEWKKRRIPAKAPVLRMVADSPKTLTAPDYQPGNYLVQPVDPFTLFRRMMTGRSLPAG